MLIAVDLRHAPAARRAAAAGRVRGADRGGATCCCTRATSSTLEVLRELEAIGPPLVAVHGNVDTAELRRLLPEERVVEAGGARIGDGARRRPAARAP